MHSGTDPQYTWRWLEGEDRSVRHTHVHNLHTLCTQTHIYIHTQADTYCSSSHLIGHHSQTPRHTSSQRWCTYHCCTWTPQNDKAGGRLQDTHNQYGEIKWKCFWNFNHPCQCKTIYLKVISGKTKMLLQGQNRNKHLGQDMHVSKESNISIQDQTNPHTLLLMI
jgi:hypothetical protein